MRFGLLGEIQAYRSGLPLDVGTRRQRCVLAALAYDANRTVTTDELIDRVWGDDLPDTARGTLSVYITRLRQALDGVAIERRHGGYLLAVEPEQVDVHAYRSLLRRARASADDRAAAALFDQAGQLWRGRVLDGLDTPWADAVRAELDGERFDAETDHADVRLRLGEHSALLASLSARAERHPLDERLAGQLILALHRNGRAADALAAYQDVRKRLVTELGVEPGPALRALHAKILADTDDAPTPVPSSAPHQLPYAPNRFTGRVAELRALSSRLPGNRADFGLAVISAIGGGGGVGKTWLALHWAHEHADRFPDGQLYVNLRGFAPDGKPTEPAVALRGFLRALGASPVSVPDDLDEQATLYRSLVAGRRILVVLDNAVDTAQVVPLLPGSPSCTTVITSRNPLTGLVATHGALAVPLDVLGDAEARDLLAGHLGTARMAAEPEAVEDLLRYCAGLPLALAIVGARATTRTDLSLAALADELRRTRLDALDTGDSDLNLRAVLSWSHNALRPATAAAFALLGIAPGPDISLAAARNLLGADADRALAELQAAQLVNEAEPGRFRMHDLVRLYAREQSSEVDDRALRRLHSFYLHTAHGGDRIIEPHRAPIALTPPEPGCEPLAFADQAAALAWYDTEQAVLLAAQRSAAEHGWHDIAWQLAWSLTAYYYRRGNHLDLVAVWEVGRASTDVLGDVPARIQAMRRLGDAYANIKRHDEAVANLEQALDLATQIGDVAGQAHTNHMLTAAWQENGDYRRALAHARQTLRFYRQLGNPLWEADALNSNGWQLAHLGEYEEARQCCEAAVAVHREHGYRDGEGDTLDSLGFIAHRAGDHRAAVEHYQAALAIRRDLDDQTGLSVSLSGIGHAYAALGETDAAREAWTQARDLYRRHRRDGDADEIDKLLAGLA